MIATSAHSIDLPAWITVAILIGGFLTAGLIALRGGSGTAVAGLQATNRELERQVHVLGEKVHQLEKENAELRGKTDVAAQIVPVLEALRSHEVNAGLRSESMLTVLNLIAARLGPDPANHG